MSDSTEYRRQRRQQIRDELAEIRAEDAPLRPSRTSATVLVPVVDLPWYQDRKADR